MLTLHVNCLEETGRNVEAHGMWHMLLLNDCGIGKLSKDDRKAELCIVVSSMISIKSQDLRHGYIFCKNRAYIQRLTHLGPHTIEVAHNPDLIIPGAYK